MTGRHVTISSVSTMPRRFIREGLRNTSTHTEVSTRNTTLSPLPGTGFLITPHFAEVTLPEPRFGQFEYAIRLRSAHKLLESALDGARVGSLAAQANRLFEQVFI